MARGLEVEATESVDRPVGPTWSTLLAAGRGVPAVDLGVGAGSVGDVAEATAGFRQHFYALAPHLCELSGAPPSAVPVATTGLVDPLHLAWGERPARIAGRRWSQPAVDLAGVERDDPAVAAWVTAHLRPKLLVAPQTRVVEVAVDGAGRFVPGVPLVAVAPRDAVAGERRAGAAGAFCTLADRLCGEPVEAALWLLAAALSAPPVAAWAFQQAAGTARDRDAVRLAARQVRRVPLPVDVDAWAGTARRLWSGEPLVTVGAALTEAYGLDASHPVTGWWAERLVRTGRSGPTDPFAGPAAPPVSPG